MRAEVAMRGENARESHMRGAAGPSSLCAVVTLRGPSSLCALVTMRGPQFPVRARAREGPKGGPIGYARGISGPQAVPRSPTLQCAEIPIGEGRAVSYRGWECAEQSFRAMRGHGTWPMRGACEFAMRESCQAEYRSSWLRGIVADATVGICWQRCCC